MPGEPSWPPWRLQQALQARHGRREPGRAAQHRGAHRARGGRQPGRGEPSAVYRRGRDLRAGQSAPAAGGPRRHSPQHRHPAAGAGRGPRGRQQGSSAWRVDAALTAGVPGAWGHAAAVGGAGAWGTRLESVRRARAGNGDAARALAARHPRAGTGARHRRRARHRQVTAALRIRPEPARSVR